MDKSEDPTTSMRQVERAVFDLRRGLPVVITGGDGDLLIQALEYGGTRAVNEIQQLAGAPPALLLARSRLEALGLATDAVAGDTARLPLPAGVSGEAVMRLATGASAGPAGDQVGIAMTGADGEGAGLRLARRAQLLPAVLAAPVNGECDGAVRGAVADGQLLAVPRERVNAYLASPPGALQQVSEARVPLAGVSQSRFVLFREPDGLREHVAVVIGSVGQRSEPVPVRLHSACLTGDLFASLRCDCGDQLRNAVAQISALGGGALLYLAQEGRGIGLANKLRAYTLQDTGLDTLDADRLLGFGDDERDYGVAVEMLSALGIKRARLLTNNPDKLRALVEGGIEVAARQGLYGELNRHNDRYLSAKAERAGHLLDPMFRSRSRQDSG